MNKNKNFSQIATLLIVLVVVGFGYVVIKNTIHTKDQSAQVLNTNSTLTLSAQENPVAQSKISAPIFAYVSSKKDTSVSSDILQQIKTMQTSAKDKIKKIPAKNSETLNVTNTSVSSNLSGNSTLPVDKKIESIGLPKGIAATQNLRPRIIYMGGVTDRFYGSPSTYGVAYNNDVWDLTNGQMLPPASASYDGSNPGPWKTRVSFSTVYFNNKIWLIGGWTGNVCSNEIWSSVDGGRNWSSVFTDTPFPGRASFTLTVFQNEIYLIGGVDCTGNVLDDVWKSSDGADWQQITSGDPLLKRAGHQAFVYQNKLFVVGGFRQVNGYGYVNDVISSTDGITWNTVNANAPWGERANHGALTLNGKIYVFGGVKVTDPSDFFDFYFTPTAGLGFWWSPSQFTTNVYGDVWSSSDGGVTWNPITLSAPWGPREEHSSVVMNNRIYLISGAKDLWSLPVFAEHDFWQSADGLNWTQVTPNAPWIERAAASAVVVPPGYGDGVFPAIPNVSTLGPTTVSNTSINFLGSYSSPIPNLEYWFEYWNPSFIAQTMRLISTLSSQTVTDTLNSLVPQTSYFYRFAAQNSTGISYGQFILSSTSGCSTPNPSVRIIYPNGSSESFSAGQPVNITWDSCNIPLAEVGYMGIALASGGPYITTAPYYMSNDGNETLMLPTVVTPGWYKVTVAFPTSGVADFSDAPFWIN